jgi:hypothetical protein
LKTKTEIREEIARTKIQIGRIMEPCFQYNGNYQSLYSELHGYTEALKWVLSGNDNGGIELPKDLSKRIEKTPLFKQKV